MRRNWQNLHEMASLEVPVTVYRNNLGTRGATVDAGWAASHCLSVRLTLLSATAAASVALR